LTSCICWDVEGGSYRICVGSKGRDAKVFTFGRKGLQCGRTSSNNIT